MYILYIYTYIHDILEKGKMRICLKIPSFTCPHLSQLMRKNPPASTTPPSKGGNRHSSGFIIDMIHQVPSLQSPGNFIVLVYSSFGSLDSKKKVPKETCLNYPNLRFQEPH